MILGRKFTKLMGIDLPIVQGGMAVGISGPKLVSAVSNNGALGTLAGAGLKPKELREWILKTKKLTSRPFGVNLMVGLYDFFELLEVCIKEKVNFVVLGAGFSRSGIKILNEADIKSFVITSSLKATKLAVKSGAFGIIIEAPDKAGGHLGIQEKNPKDIKKHLKKSIWDLLLEIVPEVRKDGFKGPIIAAGGILKNKDIKKALKFGADAVQMGTRFAMSEESGASSFVKQKWLSAKKTKIIISPVGLPGRVIFSQNTENLPTMKDLKKCEKCLSFCGRQYCILEVLRNATRKGASENEVLIFSGARVGEIKNILPVSKIISSLIDKL